MRHLKLLLATLLLSLIMIQGVAQPQEPPEPLKGSAIVASSTNYGNIRAFPVEDVINNLGISAWRRQGWTGLNVKVGVIDVGFRGILDFEQRTGVQVLIPDVKDEYNQQDAAHGTEVLEVINDIATGAALYACSYTDFDGYTRCVSWMISSGVRIINHSVGVPALPLDGTNEWAKEVERAATQEILWVNAAGNFNKGYIKGIFTNYPGTPYSVFLGGGQLGDTLQIPQIADTPTFSRILLSWEGINGVAANAIDLDLELYYADGTMEFSQGQQRGLLGDLPLEILNVDISKPFYVKIRDISGLAAGLRYVLFIEFADIPGGETQQSIIAPGDSEYSLTVGALQNNVVAPYSSRGPLVNNRVKPDLVAPGEILLNDGSRFIGTSAAAPVVAGVAAMIWEANPEWTRQQIYDYLKLGAVQDDQDLRGPDGNYGQGFLFLPPNIPRRTVDVGTQDTVSGLGKLPFRNNFEQVGTALDQWSYDAAVWQVTRVGGSNVLVGQGELEAPVWILDSIQPEWLDPLLEEDLVISFDFNLQKQSGGLRYIFRYNESAGYNALELFPGRLILKRNNQKNPADIFNRDNEIVISNESAPINEETWHNVTMWVSGKQIYVYLDRQLFQRIQDPYQPELFAGKMAFQVNQPFRQVRVDNIQIQKAARASDHFEASTLPGSWQTNDTVNTTIGQESSPNNQFVRLKGQIELRPDITETQDLRVSCRYWSEQGGYEVWMRSTQDGALVFDFEGGTLTVKMVDDFGDSEWSTKIENLYNRGRWDDFTFNVVGSNLEIYKDGQLKFSGSVGGRIDPQPGIIKFVTGKQDVLRLDDCLITEILTQGN